MAVTRLPQEHVETKGSSIDDTLLPTNHDGNAVDLRDTVDYLASQIADITGESAWETAPVLSISAINAKTFLDEKLALRWVPLLTDTTVPGTQNYKILSVAGSEVPGGKVKAIGATTQGLVTVAHGGTFGTTHSLAEVSGKSALFPKNLLRVWDGSTGDPIVSAGREVYGLLQNEASATDGTAFTDTTPERAQVSFVRPNATYDDLEACPVADIENKIVNLAFVDRSTIDSFTEQDFLSDIEHIDLGVGGAATTLDNAIDNQGATPATQATNISIQINDAVSWSFQDSIGAKNILQVAPNAGNDAVNINADTVDVNVGASGTVDIDNGITVDSGGTPINVGVTAGQIDAGAAALTMKSTGASVSSDGIGVTLNANSGNLVADGVNLDVDFTGLDVHIVQSANSASNALTRIAATNVGAGTADLELEADGDVLFETVRETTPLPLDDATSGPISTLFGQSFASVAAAIKYAGDSAGDQLSMKLFVLGSNFGSGVNIPGATLDLTVYTLDMSSDTATVFVFHNGRLMRGASGSGVGDVYPGTVPSNGDLKHDFPAPFKTNDVLISVGFA